jgi:hypothetical protein
MIELLPQTHSPEVDYSLFISSVREYKSGLVYPKKTQWFL